MNTVVHALNRISIQSAPVAMVIGIAPPSAADELIAGKILAITAPAYVRTDLRTAAKRLDPRHDVNRVIRVGERLGCGPRGTVTYREWKTVKKPAGGKARILWVLIKLSSATTDNQRSGRNGSHH